MRRVAKIVFISSLLSTACGSSASEPSQPTDPPTAAGTTSALPAPAAADIVLAEGTFEVPAAGSFTDPGFHEVLLVTATTPPDSVTGQTLVLRLRDVERPDRQCDSDHPLSGCITVDWSDFEGRPGVPPGGVFDNHLTIQLASGPRTFYLSETGSLANESDAHAPG